MLQECEWSLSSSEMSFHMISPHDCITFYSFSINTTNNICVGATDITSPIQTREILVCIGGVSGQAKTVPSATAEEIQGLTSNPENVLFRGHRKCTDSVHLSAVW